MTKNLNDLLIRYSILSSCQEDILNAYTLLKTAYQQNKKLLVCGNGVSAGDSEHIVGELMKGFVSKRHLPEEMRQKFKDEFDEDGIYLANHLQGALPAISLVKFFGWLLQKILKAVKEMPEFFSSEQDFMQVKYQDL